MMKFLFPGIELMSMFLFMLGMPAHSQNRMERREGMERMNLMQREGEYAFIETLVIPSEIYDMAALDLHIRVLPKALVFTRSASFHPDSAYRAGIQVSIDIFNEQNEMIKNGRQYDRTVFAREEEKSNGKLPDIFFYDSSQLPAGRYRARVNITVGESQRELNIDVPVVIKDFGKLNPVAVSFLPIRIDEAVSPQEYAPIGYGGSVLFMESANFLLLYQGDSSASVTAELRPLFSKNDPVFYEAKVVRTISSATVSFNEQKEFPTYSITPSTSASNTVKVLSFPFDTLDYGSYKLTLIVAQQNRRDSIQQPMTIYWREMPRSLRMAPRAIALMKYILTPSQLDEMRDGTPEQQERKFKAYWKAQDPTPRTLINERFVEYFRRADQADELYGSLTKPEGSMTDRGKIYILNGAPEKVERLLIPDQAPREVWYYPSLKKKFVFANIDRMTEFKLIEQSEL